MARKRKPSAGGAEKIEGVGRALGMLIQISDDINDALESPAGPDWKRPSGNLALLYALVAEHDEREEFLRLSGQADDPATFEAARGILFRCGAAAPAF